MYTQGKNSVNTRPATTLACATPVAVSIVATACGIFSLLSGDNTAASIAVTGLFTSMFVAIAWLQVTGLERMVCLNAGDTPQEGKAGLVAIMMLGYAAIETGLGHYGINWLFNLAGTEFHWSVSWIISGFFALTNALAKWAYLTDGPIDETISPPQPGRRSPRNSSPAQKAIDASANVTPIQRREHDKGVTALMQTIQADLGAKDAETAETDDQKRRFKWTNDRLDTLKVLLKTMTRNEAAAELGTTPGSVDGACYRHSIAA